MRSTTKKNKSPMPSKNPKHSARDYPAVIAWSEEDKCSVARVPILEGCMSHGDTMEQAARNILDAAEGWLDVAAKHGDHVPAPPKSMSSKLVLRMPKVLHAQVAERAAREGGSINTWIVTAIARSDGS